MPIYTKNPHKFRYLIAGAILLGGCAAGDARFTAADAAGFFYGFWHGLIACVTLIIGIFSDNVEVYERANTGGWYDFGFLLGVMCLSGSGHKSHQSWRCRNDEGLPRSGKLKAEVSWSSEDEDED